MTFHIQNIVGMLVALFLYLYTGERIKDWVQDRTRWSPVTVNIVVNTIWIILVFALVSANAIIQGDVKIKASG